jgi:hypothetical protein
MVISLPLLMLWLPWNVSLAHLLSWGILFYVGPTTSKDSESSLDQPLPF